MHSVLYLGKVHMYYIIKFLCNVHFTECPDLKPLTGRSRSMRKKAGDSSPERQESIDDTEASKRAGSKKRESCGYMYIAKSKITCMVFLKCLTNKCNMYMYFTKTFVIHSYMFYIYRIKAWL